MSGQVALDTNLALFLIVGKTDPKYISRHKKLQSSIYNLDSFRRLEELISRFSGVVVLPNVLTEVANQCDGGLLEPAVGQMREKLVTLVVESDEVYIQSRLATDRREFRWLGLTDAALLILCSCSYGDSAPTLLTVDQPLANRAQALGLSVINYREYLEYL